MPCTVPEKYEYLHAAFPGANLFDAMGELNANGKMAEELFAKRKLLKEAIFVHVLQRVVEVVVPLIEEHVDVYQPQVQRDDHREQAARRPALF